MGIEDPEKRREQAAAKEAAKAEKNAEKEAQSDRVWTQQESDWINRERRGAAASDASHWRVGRGKYWMVHKMMDELREGLREGNIPPITSRDQLPNTIPALRALADRVNVYYGNQLPDGNGPLRMVADSKIRNAKLIFIRRLGL
jgi:hypothetical protein